MSKHPAVVAAEATEQSLLRQNDTAAAAARGAVKYDSGKVPIVSQFLRYFPYATIAVAMVSEYGSRKYQEMGWRDVVDALKRYSDADGRHLVLPFLKEGQNDYDEESALAHLVQHAWNAMALVELAIREGKIEVRRGNEIDKSTGTPRPIPGTHKVVKL